MAFYKINKVARKLKWKLAQILFKDVMDIHAQKYLYYNRYPEAAIKELSSISKNRLMTDLEDKLENGINSNDLYTDLYNSYTFLLTYDFDSITLEVAKQYEDIVNDFQKSNHVLINKEILYFLMALIYIRTNNTIDATVYWELSLQESARISGSNSNINNIINQLPSKFKSLLNPINYSHKSNVLVDCILKNYTFSNEFYTNLNNLTGIYALSYLSSGIRHVKVLQYFNSSFSNIEVIKIYGQELINSLCVLSESILKTNINIQAHISNPKDRMIGNMIQKISAINASIHNTLGNPFTDNKRGIIKSGLYVDPLLDFSTENLFNINYLNLINAIESNTLSEPDIKAYILFGMHQIRNQAMHDLKTSLVYYNNKDLFTKTIGMLFTAIDVSTNL